uniref:Uncharacterized protein n=1 Tax=Roseihalotalea indica TaxID=2867963 RepID=A0AA49JJ29_9BACT|nr:hypothetical protein K4G66_05515 [Tunicatimonas sp. TK19036]
MSKYEILEFLPAYGPMYIPVTENGEPYHSDNGFVVRFFKNDGSNWVANFKPGWTDCCGVFELANEHLLTLAYGQAYVMDTEQTTPLKTFGVTINKVIESDNELIMSDSIHIITFSRAGVYWQSERVSWDGIDKLELTGNIVSGKAYDPMTDEWLPFKLDLNTRTVQGGTF